MKALLNLTDTLTSCLEPFFEDIVQKRVDEFIATWERADRSEDAITLLEAAVNLPYEEFLPILNSIIPDEANYTNTRKFLENFCKQCNGDEEIILEMDGRLKQLIHPRRITNLSNKELSCQIGHYLKSKNNEYLLQKYPQIYLETIEQRIGVNSQNLHILLSTYLDNNINDLESIKNVISLLEIINQKPEDKICLEKVAKKFTDGQTDLNKNAAGLFQVFSWLMISEQESEEGKLELLIPLMVYDIANKFVGKKLGENPDPLDLQLFTNIALQKIHQKLKENEKLESDWPAIPKLSFPKQVNTIDQFSRVLVNQPESKIEKFFTQEEIEHIYGEVSQIVEEVRDENIDQFFMDKGEILKLWCQITFPKEYEALVENHKKYEVKYLGVTTEVGWFDNFKIINDKIIDLTKAIPKTKSSPYNYNSLQSSSKRLAMGS